MTNLCMHTQKTYKIKVLKYFSAYLSVYLCVFQLTPVNTVVFTVQATDADNDKIIYSIDQTSVSSTLLLFTKKEKKNLMH